MTYTTLMVHLELGQTNAGLLHIAGDLAERFHANVIGIAACQSMPIAYGDTYVSGDILEQLRKESEKEIKKAEAEFRSALQTRAETLEWRSTVTLGSLVNYVAHEARSADLIITKAIPREFLDNSRRLNIGEFVLHAGRPVLIVPGAADQLKLERVVVAWKDIREARRAVLDALPLLKKADHVVVVEITAEEKLSGARMHLEDVVGWLKRHGIVAEALASSSIGDDATRLKAIVQEQGADLIVAGAYGHSRLRELVLGGMTGDLLLCADRCSLVSH